MQDWWILKSRKNRYDLAAKYPRMATQILDASAADNNPTKYTDPSKLIAQTALGTTETDDVDYYEFYHRTSNAVPQGRYTIFLNADTVLFDGPLPFKEMPIHRVSCADIIGTSFGWTPAWDILGLQIAVDKLYTTILTNQMATGLQNYWSPPGNDINTSQFTGGNLIESAVEPKVLQLLQTAPEVFNFLNKLESSMETLSGVNSVARGNPEASLKSGAALAMVASQAIQFNSGLANSYNQLIESVGTGLLQILKDYAATPRLAVIAGSFNRPLMKTYIGNDLASIDRVVVDATSALSKTEAGKLQIANDLLQKGLISTRKNIYLWLTQGKLNLCMNLRCQKFF